MKKSPVYLNIRKGLLASTKKKMRKLCKEQDINYGELLNRTFNLSTGKK